MKLALLMISALPWPALGEIPPVPPPPSSNGPQPAQGGQTLTEAQQKLLSTISSKRLGPTAPEAKDAMVYFLKSWNPIGRSVKELDTTFGKADKGLGTYYFDTGLSGMVFEFMLEDGQVFDVQIRTY